MIKLIKNELFKIFHKKSIYILAIIIFGFVLLDNLLYKSFYDKEGNIENISLEDNTWEITYYAERLEELDVNKESDREKYVSCKTDYDIAVLLNIYEENSWQYNIINSYLYDIIYNINYYTYIESNDKLLKEYKDKYDYYLNSLENNNFNVFINEELSSVTKEIADLEKIKNNTVSIKEIEDINNKLDTLYLKKEIIDYRISNNVTYSNSYLNTALETYNDTSLYLQNNNPESLSYDEKIVYNENLADNQISKYILDHKVNLNKENSLHNILKNVFSSYEMFIVILIIIIAGTIISSEYNKGTIKQLLIRPYSRTTIFISKYLTSFIILIISILYIVIINLLIGGLFFGFDSLNIPVVIYNFNTLMIEEYNIFTYLGITLLAKLPLLILIMTLSICLSTTLLNSAISVALPILLYIFAPVISSLTINFNLKWLRYFCTLNWDLTSMLFGNLPTFKYVNLHFSIIISIIYLIIMFLISLIIFKKRDIKNI